jgi:hypothetical protein
MTRRAPAILVAAFLAAGCGGATSPSPTQPWTPAPALTPTAAPPATPAPTAVPTPAESINAFPPTQQELDLGRYDSSPPFDVEFTFEIPAAGWNTAHMHHDFFDVMRFDGPDPVSPTAWVAWGVPVNVIGTEERPATDLDPSEAAELMSSKPGVTALEPVPFSFLGREGVQVDLRADRPNTYIFGNGSTTGDGNFGLDPTYPMRIGIVENDPGLLFVLCISPDDQSDSGCGGEQQEIIDSAR